MDRRLRRNRRPRPEKSSAGRWTPTGAVGGATVCLSHEDDSDNVLAEPIVLAQTQTRADGRFELLPLESDLKKVVAEPPTVFEVWIQKTGLAPSHRVLLGEQADEVLLITLKNETRLTVRLRDASEAPCGDVTVAPSYLLLADHRWVTVPKPIKDRLKAAQCGRRSRSGLWIRRPGADVDRRDSRVRRSIAGD